MKRHSGLDPESINADRNRLQLGGRSDKSGQNTNSSFRHSELVSESLNKSIDSGSEAGMTKMASNNLRPAIRSDKSSRIPRTPSRHSDGSQSLSMPVNLIRHLWQQKSRKAAFTMAEVLITLGIIGIIAAMTLPAVIKKYQEVQFKSAYKKAYSELSQVFQEALLNQEFTRTKSYDAASTLEEFAVFKSGFKIMIDCENKDIYRCWAKGDTVCGGSCSSGDQSDGIDLENGAPSENTSYCFLDVSGRSWCVYEKGQNIFLVDTNGFSRPNLFGKDRWIFTFGDANNKHANKAQKYRKVITFYNQDILKQSSFCKHPPCYYYSWLLN